MPVSQRKSSRQAVIKCVQRVSLLFLIAIFISIAPMKAFSETKEEVSFEFWFEKVQAMYTFVEQEKYEEGKKIYDWLHQHFPAVSFSSYGLDTDQIRNFLFAFERAGKAVTSVQLSEENRQAYMYSFYLAADAVISTTNPLWKKVAQESLPLLEEAKTYIERGEKEKARASYQAWQHTFEKIRPAIMTGEEERLYTPLFSYLEYMENESSWLEREESDDILQLMTQLKQLIEPARSTVDPSFWLVMFSIGTAIMIALIYTGWRKYKGEKMKERVRE